MTGRKKFFRTHFYLSLIGTRVLSTVVVTKDGEPKGEILILRRDWEAREKKAEELSKIWIEQMLFMSLLFSYFFNETWTHYIMIE